MPKYMVLYAKIVDDKDMGALMTGIFIGGFRDTEAEADELATKCVSETQGGIIIPKITVVDECVRDAVNDLEGKFDTLANQIYENERILSKGSKQSD